MKPDILANELAEDQRKAEDSDEDGYIETVVRTEKRKVVLKVFAC